MCPCTSKTKVNNDAAYPSVSPHKVTNDTAYLPVSLPKQGH